MERKDEWRKGKNKREKGRIEKGRRRKRRKAPPIHIFDYVTDRVWLFRGNPARRRGAWSQVDVTVRSAGRTTACHSSLSRPPPLAVVVSVWTIVFLRPVMSAATVRWAPRSDRFAPANPGLVAGVADLLRPCSNRLVAVINYSTRLRHIKMSVPWKIRPGTNNHELNMSPPY